MYLVPRFSWSLKKQSLAPKKLYIADNGIIRTGSASFTENIGHIFENYIFNAFRTETDDIFYFQEKDHECDFIVGAHTETPHCVQVCNKLSKDNEEREIRGLITAMDFFNQKEGYIITKNQTDIILEQGKKINVVSAWKFFGQTG